MLRALVLVGLVGCGAGMETYAVAVECAGQCPARLAELQGISIDEGEVMLSGGEWLAVVGATRNGNVLQVEVFAWVEGQEWLEPFELVADGETLEAELVYHVARRAPIVATVRGTRR